MKSFSQKDIVVVFSPGICWTYVDSGVEWVEREKSTIEKIITPYMGVLASTDKKVSWYFDKKYWGNKLRYSVDSPGWKAPLWDDPFFVFCTQLQKYVNQKMKGEKHVEIFV